MIGRLAFAQLRAHRAQTAWLAALLTVLAGIVTAILVMGATQARLSALAASAVWSDAERVAYTQATLGEAPEDWGEARPDDLSRALAETEGGRLIAETQLYDSEPVVDDWYSAQSFFVLAYADPQAAAGLVVEGSAPTGLGEVAIGAELADRLDVALGDTVTLWKPSWNQPSGELTADPVTLTVVGYIYSSTLPGYDLWDVPGAIVSWPEATTRGGVMVTEYTDRGKEVDVVDLRVRWNGSSPVLDALLSQGSNTMSERGRISLPNSTGPWLGAGVALVAAMVIMSFAVGRSQAATRTRWVATTRTLGASRAYVALATVVETALVATLALVIGTVIGVAAAQAHLAIARSLVVNSLGPSTAAVHEATVPIVAAVLAFVAIVVAAVPAFWASRVPPAAALKPVNDVTEAELSRRVSVRWLWIPLLVGASTSAWGNRYADVGMAPLVWLGWIAVCVTGLALVVEGMRRLMPLIGRRMAKSPRRALILAGDALRLRPRQAVAPALITAVGAGLVAETMASAFEQVAYAFLHPSVYQGRREAIRGAVEWALSSTTVVSIAVVALATQGVIAAIAASHRASVASETGTLRALGVSAAEERRAFWWQQWVPQVAGVVVGIPVGLAVDVVVALVVTSAAPELIALRSVIALIPVTFVAIAALTLAAAVAWIVARATTRATAVAALRPPS